MFRWFMLTFLFLFSLSVFAEDLALGGFQKRFALERNDQGKVMAIKLKFGTKKFSIKPLIQQLKKDLLDEKASFHQSSVLSKEWEIDEIFSAIEENQFLAESDFVEEKNWMKKAILSLKDADVETTFSSLMQEDFWKEFESKVNEALLFIDPTVIANLDDPRFFYKRTASYEVIRWALEQAKKRFSSIPVLNIASFIIVRVQDMILEQRHFHHNMLLHYFETISEDKLGMTKEEVDRAVSSIYEYRIELTNIFESNRAAKDWLNYGMDLFYKSVRAGNTKINSWKGMFSDIEKLNFAFAKVTDQSNSKIYHLHHNLHQFSKKPSLAFDYARPELVKRNRMFLNIAGLALGFVRIPIQIKSNIDNFIKSFYVSQVRTEGALIGYFESQGDLEMIDFIFSQRANPYILVE
jgi:hypothetical protein